MAAPKLSIITPSFNQGPFLERTIRSVLDQGYPNLEYVVVDGGSTDESVEIIKRYEDQLAWWVSEPDGGQTEAINKGIERTSGEIVAYINSDDYYMPGAFEKAIGAFESSGASWVAGASVDIAEADDGEAVRRLPELGQSGGRRLLPATAPATTERVIRGRHWWLLSTWHVPQPSSFWSRELFARFGLFRLDMHYAFDAEFMLRIALGGQLPGLLVDELAVRSVHPDQKSADYRLWQPELRQIAHDLRPRLTRRERARMALTQALLATRVLPAYELVMAKVVGPLLERGGDLLEHLPERVRPTIRTRDRKPELHRGSDA